MDMLLGNNDEYEEFVDKFKPKLTTDDCYTPENVYEAVRGWVFDHYQLPKDTPVVRPFWPGGDYQRVEYPDGCVVIDNPPFSIIGEIERWYLKREIRFFLFAPALTIFKDYRGLNYVLINKAITYANGAKVTTSFVTNMGEWIVEVCPDLHEAVDQADRINVKGKGKQLQKYELPLEVATAAKLGQLAKHGVAYRIRPEDAVKISTIDSMRESGKTLFGGGLLLSKRAAAERAAAERAAAERAAADRKNATVWELSERDRKMVEGLRHERRQQLLPQKTAQTMARRCARASWLPVREVQTLWTQAAKW